MKTAETKAKALEVKYAHERDALTWAMNKAFEIASEEFCVDDVGNMSVIADVARRHQLGDWQRWDKLRDRIEELAAQEDAAAAAEENTALQEAGAELAGDCERDER